MARVKLQKLKELLGDIAEFRTVNLVKGTIAFDVQVDKGDEVLKILKEHNIDGGVLGKKDDKLVVFFVDYTEEE